MTTWTEQPDYADFQIIRAPDWNKIVRDDQRFLYEAWAFRWSALAGVGPSPPNGVQTIELDFTGTHTEVNSGGYTLSYGAKTTPAIPWNAQAAEVQQVIMNTFDPELTYTTGRFQSLRPGVTVTGSDIGSPGFTLTFDTARINPGGPILEMVMTNVNLAFDGESFDGDLVVTTVVAADEFGQIPITRSAATDFSSPPTLNPLDIGDYPGYWNIHAMVFTAGGFGGADGRAEIRINGDTVAWGRAVSSTGIGPTNFVIELNWAGLVVEDDVMGFFIDTSSGTGFFRNTSTWFEGFYSGEVVE